MAFPGGGVKKFGLEIRQKKPLKPAPISKKAAPVFGADDDDDEDGDGIGGAGGWGVEKEIARQAERKKHQKEADQAQAAVLAEDPNAFAYDEVYDDLHAPRDLARVQEQTERKPKYIAALLAKTKEREKEKEIVFERKLAKERAQEQDEFGDKEQFVTRAYREKLEERKKWLEEEKRREAIESANDVTKRKDLNDLYRNLFHSRTQSSGPSPPAAESKTSREDEPRALRDEGGAEPAARARREGEGSRWRSGRGQSEDDPSVAGERHARSQKERGDAGTDGQEDVGDAAGQREGLTGHTDDPMRVSVAPLGTGQRASPARAVREEHVNVKGGGDDEAELQPGADSSERKSRVTTNALSAAKERYLSRKRQRQEGDA